VKEVLPWVSNVVVVGNGRKFLVCLVTLKSDWRGLESESVAPTTGLHPLALQCACRVQGLGVWQVQVGVGWGEGLSVCVWGGGGR
jgi:hypothetical protein